MASWNLKEADRFKMNDSRICQLIGTIVVKSGIDIFFFQELKSNSEDYDGILDPLRRAVCGLTDAYSVLAVDVGGREGMGVLWKTAKVSAVDLIGSINALNGHLRKTPIFKITPRDGVALSVAVVHLASPQSASNPIEQLTQMKQALEDHNCRVILGDFNHQPHLDGWERALTDVPTSIGENMLDNFLLKSPLAHILKSVKVIRRDGAPLHCLTQDGHLASDHYPLIATIWYEQSLTTLIGEIVHNIQMQDERVVYHLFQRLIDDFESAASSNSTEVPWKVLEAAARLKSHIRSPR